MTPVPKQTDVCPKCSSKEHIIIKEYDIIWGDAEVWCSECNIFIRHWDRD